MLLLSVIRFIANKGVGPTGEVQELAVVGVHRALFAVRSAAERLQGTPLR